MPCPFSQAMKSRLSHLKYKSSSSNCSHEKRGNVKYLWQSLKVCLSLKISALYARVFLRHYASNLNCYESVMPFKRGKLFPYMTADKGRSASVQVEYQCKITKLKKVSEITQSRWGNLASTALTFPRQLGGLKRAVIRCITEILRDSS